MHKPVNLIYRIGMIPVVLVALLTFSSLVSAKPVTGTNICPKNCTTWYDGCNTCKCVNGVITACTKRLCVRQGKPYCKVRKKGCKSCALIKCKKGYSCQTKKGCGRCVPLHKPKRCPRNCKTWYDGCNTCFCKNGKITGCTKKFCRKYGKPYCKTKTGYEVIKP